MHNIILRLIKEYDTIIIHRHSRPDGDALGSQYGLKEVIKTTFPKKKVFAVGDMSKKYNFMGNIDEVNDKMYEHALVFVLDCSEKSLVNDKRFENGKKLIKIDHHIMRESFGDVEIVDETYESCCGLIADICFKLRLSINNYAAQSFFTGIITDSGRFRFDSTTSRTFNIVSKLCECHFNMMEVYNNLYTEDLDMVILRAKYVLKMKFTENNVAYIITTDEELKKENLDVFTVSRSMVNTMAGIKNVDIWVNFTEDLSNNGIIVEIRSSKYNINGIAVKYGGGGHAKASGATVPSFEVAKLLLEELNKLAGGNDE